MKSALPFLLCLLLSLGIWLTHNLSLTYSDLVSVPVIAESCLEGRAGRSSAEVEIAARVRSSGFNLIWLSRKGTTMVFFDPSDLFYAGDDLYGIRPEALTRYATDIYGDAVSVEGFISSNLRFKFAKEFSRKVPVKVVKSLTFKPQYTLKGEIAATPDSVIVFGDEWRVKDIDAISTRPIIHNELRKPVHGSAKLIKPAGVRLSAESITYSIELSRFVELQASKNITVRGVPEGLSVSAYPGTAKIFLKCIFPLSSSNPADEASLFVDYDAFRESANGVCVIQCDSLPENVLDMRIEPQVCECIENILAR